MYGSFFVFYQSYTTQGLIWAKMNTKYQLSKYNAKIHSENDWKRKKTQIEGLQNECEVTNLYRKHKNKKNEKNQLLRISYKKKLIFLKIQNLLPILTFVTSPLKNVFF